MNVETSGIVLRKKKVAGVDVIITVLTRDYGKKSVYVKGARHTKSKYAAYTEIFTEAKFQLYLKKDLCNINSVDSITAHSKLRNDMNRLFIGTYMLELVDVFTAEDDGDAKLYDMVSFAIKFLTEEVEENFLLLRTVFLAKLLKLNGYMPEVEKCAICSSIKDIAVFSPQKKGILCSKCSSKAFDAENVDYDFLKMINILLKKSYLTVRTMAVGDIITRKVDSELYRFAMSLPISKTIKSREMLLEMGI